MDSERTADVEALIGKVVEQLKERLPGLLGDALLDVDGYCQLLDRLEELAERVDRLETTVRDLRASPLAVAASPALAASPVTPAAPAAAPVPPPVSNGLGTSGLVRRRPLRARSSVPPTVVTIRSEPRTPVLPVTPPGSPLARAVVDSVSPAPASPAPSGPMETKQNGTAPAQGEKDPRLCSEPGCDRPARSRGLCSAHYQRLRYREKKIGARIETSPALPPVPAAAFGLAPPPATSLGTVPLPKVAPQATVRREGGTKGIFAVLYEDKGRRTLAGLINQIRLDRHELVERVNHTFAGLPGTPLEEEDVLRAVHYHKLGDALLRRECDVVRRAFQRNRGSLAKAAQQLKSDPERLQARLRELNLTEDINRIRAGFAEAVLSQSFAERLDLALTREKYLEDLGIEKEVDTSLRDDLARERDKLGGGATLLQAAESLRAGLGLDDERYRRMLRRFGLGGDANETAAATESP